MSPRPFVLAAAIMIALTSACSNNTPAPPAAPAPPDVTSSPRASATTASPVSGRYVAIGDSYTAGPGIKPEDTDSGFCRRSNRNFPSMLAQQLSTTLVDVSCSGATTQTATQGANGLAGVTAPQLDALTKDTDLVTVGIGGNDGQLFQTLIQSCAKSAAACTGFVEGREPAILTKTTGRVAQVLDDVASRSPDATVVLVGYLRLSPETGTCPALGIDPAAQDSVRASEVALEGALKAAAAEADVPFVSMHRLSVGHDACAGPDAWTNGVTAPSSDGIIFHPRKAGMAAVAKAVAGVL